MTHHQYATHLAWQGSTAAGPRRFSRDHTGSAPPATPELALSADAGFGGDASRLNPEQLVVLAASSCQMLSFTGAAARAGVEVLDYVDEATSHLDLGADPPRLGTIRLDVVVRVAAGVGEDVVLGLVEEAHRACFVANSLAVPVEVTTTVETA